MLRNRIKALIKILTIIGIFIVGCVEEAPVKSINETIENVTPEIEKNVTPMPPEPKKPMRMEDKIASIIASFDSENPQSFSAIEEIVEIGEPAIPILLDMLDDGNLYERWASVYALGRIGFYADKKKQEEILPHLKKAFGDPNPTIKTLAAGTATAFGDPSGIPILIESLESDEVELFSEPPELLRAYSMTVLRHYTQQDFGYDVKKWREWLDDNKDSLVWDDEKKVFVI